MQIEIEMIEGANPDEMHKLAEAIKFMIWSNEVKTVESITEKVQ